MSIPAGKRSWKCPECGREVLLSVTQLDPIACKACLAKLNDAGKSAIPDSVANVAGAPLHLWQSLSEMTKLAAVAIALVVGLLIGYVIGSLHSKASTQTSTPASRSEEVSRTAHEDPSDTPASESNSPEEAVEKRPDPPGPGYKWVRGRIRKDGTRGEGHWAQDPRYK